MEHNDYPRTVFGLGYAHTKCSRKDNPKAASMWYSLISRVMNNGTGFNSIDLHSSWECFENFLAWYDKKRAKMKTLKSIHLVVVQSEYAAKTIRVNGKKQEILSVKYGPKTTKLTTTKQPTYRAPYWKDIMRFDKPSGTFKPGRVYLSGCKKAQQGRVKLPKGCALYARKEKAFAACGERGRAIDARTAELKKATDANRARRNAILAKKSAASRYCRDVLGPARAKQAQDLECALYEERVRLDGVKGLQAMQRQKGQYRHMGFLGEGPFPTSVRGKPTRSYTRWKWLLQICYQKVTDDWEKHPYAGYRLGKRFLCYQTFAKWYEKHDKDHSKPAPFFEFGPNSKGQLLLSPTNTKLKEK